jgi:CYTH domain-containing protein
VEFTHTIKHPTGHPGHRKEIERHVTEDEYHRLLERRHPAMHAIRKTRRVFIYEGHTFEFDAFREPVLSVMLLECELPSLDTEVQLPPWLPVSREVTKETGWTNTSIALNGQPPA